MALGFDAEDGDDGDGRDRVEFLDARDADGDEADVDWLEESVGQGRGRGRDPRLLPPHAARGRVLVSVLTLGLALGAAGAAGTAAYHRHEADLRAANTIELAAAAQGPSLPGLTDLAFSATWHAEPAERLVIAVVNKGPDTVTLVDGRLTEPGLRGTPTLKPVGDAVIAPGGTGELAATVTADCVAAVKNTAGYEVPLITAPSVGATDGNGQAYAGVATVTVAGTAEAVAVGPDSAANQAEKERMGALRVRARSASGRLGEQTIFPETISSTAQRICLQQGHAFAQDSNMITVVDPRRHTITVSATLTSAADVPVGYGADALFSVQPQAPGLVIPEGLTATTPTAGTLRPGSSSVVAFQVAVSRCPTAPTPIPASVSLNVDYTLGGELASISTQSTDLRPLVAEACGHAADW